MARARLEIRGLKEIQAKLRNLASDAPRTIVQPALAAGLEVLAERAIAEAPRDTGNLAGGIEVLVHPIHAQVVSGEVATTAADYAAHRDLGTSHLEADPFMERAAEAEAQRATAVVAKKISQGIDKTMR